MIDLRNLKGKEIFRKEKRDFFSAFELIKDLAEKNYHHHDLFTTESTHFFIDEVNLIEGNNLEGTIENTNVNLTLKLASLIANTLGAFEYSLHDSIRSFGILLPKGGKKKTTKSNREIKDTLINLQNKITLKRSLMKFYFYFQFDEKQLIPPIFKTKSYYFTSHR